MTDLSRIVVVDLETSGLDPVRHGILEIGACFLANPDMEGSHFEMKVRLHRALDWTAEALAVNGRDRAGLYDPALVSERDALQALFAWAGPGPLVLAGMNVGKFDLAFLSAAMARHPEVRWPKLGHRTLDMHSVALAWAAQNGKEVDVTRLSTESTDAIYLMLGLPEEPKPHRALTGAQREREALRLMMERVQPEDIEQCECGAVFPAKWTAYDSEGLSLCPDCNAGMKNEIIEVLLKKLRNQPLDTLDQGVLESFLEYENLFVAPPPLPSLPTFTPAEVADGL